MKDTTKKDLGKVHGKMKTIKEYNERIQLKIEARAYVIKLIALAEAVKDVSKSKNGRYELCAELGARNKKIQIFRGIENLAKDLGFENISKRDDIFEFEYLGYTFFQLVRFC